MLHAAVAAALPPAAAGSQELRDAMWLPPESAESFDYMDKHGERSVHRRLAQSSEGEEDLNDELEDVLQGCLELEKEYGFSAFIPEVAMEEPAAKKARIVSFLDYAVREYQGAVPPVISEAQTSTSINVGQRGAGPTQALDEEEYGDDFKGLGLPDPDPPRSPPQDTEGKWKEKVEADRWLESIPLVLKESGSPRETTAEGSTRGSVSGELLAARRRSDSQRTASSISDDSLSLVAEAWIDSFSASTAAYSEREGSESEDARAVSAGPSRAMLPTISTAKPALLGKARESNEPWNEHEHPFTRLPVMLPGAVRRSLEPGKYRTEYGASLSTLSLLKRIRGFYSRPTLDAEEAEDLLCTLETLLWVARARLKPAGRATSPSHLSEKLSTYLMVYDSLVCGMELFGSKMNFEEWWPSFVSSHTTDYRASIETRRKQRGGPSFLFHLRFINAASAALAIYKTGVRPPKKDIIRLKRMIFCEKFSPRRFAGDRGKPWREDDRKHILTHPESSDVFKKAEDE
ncbi:hypothetical protein ACSSS7_003476 [Eimeria intestinalis]